MTQKLLDFYLEHQGQINQSHPMRAWPTQEAYELLKNAQSGVLKDLKFLCAGGKIDMTDMLDHFIRLPALQGKDRFDKQRRREERQKDMRARKKEMFEIRKRTAINLKVAEKFDGEKRDLVKALVANPEYRKLVLLDEQEKRTSKTKANTNFNIGLYAIYLLGRHYNSGKNSDTIIRRIESILKNLKIRNTRGGSYSRSAISHVIKQAEHSI